MYIYIISGLSKVSKGLPTSRVSIFDTVTSVFYLWGIVKLLEMPCNLFSLDWKSKQMNSQSFISCSFLCFEADFQSITSFHINLKMSSWIENGSLGGSIMSFHFIVICFRSNMFNCIENTSPCLFHFCHTNSSERKPKSGDK